MDVSESTGKKKTTRMQETSSIEKAAGNNASPFFLSPLSSFIFVNKKATILKGLEGDDQLYFNFGGKNR